MVVAQMVNFALAPPAKFRGIFQRQPRRQHLRGLSPRGCCARPRRLTGLFFARSKGAHVKLIHLKSIIHIAFRTYHTPPLTALIATSSRSFDNV